MECRDEGTGDSGIANRIRRPTTPVNSIAMVYSQHTGSSSQSTDESVWTDDDSSSSSAVRESPRMALKDKRHHTPQTPKQRSAAIMTPPETPAELVSASGGSPISLRRRKPSAVAKGVSSSGSRGLRASSNNVSTNRQPISTRATSNVRFGPPSPIPFGNASSSPITPQQSRLLNNYPTIPTPPPKITATAISSESVPAPPPPPPPPLLPSMSPMSSMTNSSEDFTWEKTASYLHNDGGEFVQDQTQRKMFSPLMKDRNRVGGAPSQSEEQQEQYQKHLRTFTVRFIIDILSVFGLLRKPFAFLMALYIFTIILSMAGRYTTDIIYAVLSPLCSIPGVTRYELLPFCKYVSSYEDYFSNSATLVTETTKPGNDSPGAGRLSASSKKRPFGKNLSIPDYSKLTNLQSKFDEIMEDSIVGTSMVMALKNAEISVRDLSTLVKVSKLNCRGQLSYQLDEFVVQGKRTSRGLSRFGARVGGVVDMIMAMDEFALRALEEIKQRAEEERKSKFYKSFLLAPFRFKAHLEMEKQVKHTYKQASIVSGEQIQKLILEAEYLLSNIREMDLTLITIKELLVKEDSTIKAKSEEILAELWTRLGGNRRKLANLQYHHALLSSFHHSQGEAVRHVSRTLVRLGYMGDAIDELNRQIKMNQFGGGANNSLPLEVQIKTIRMAVERLSAGRKREKEWGRNLWEDTMDKMYAATVSNEGDGQGWGGSGSGRGG